MSNALEVPTTLEVSTRLYALESKTAIVSLSQVFSELITNCIDAYSVKEASGKDVSEKTIEITFDEEKRSLTVTDYAIGMSHEDMQKKLLSVGNYTASDTSRGLMGRGAKDIANMGTISFLSRKDGKVSRCSINSLLQVSLEDLEDNEEIKSKLRRKIRKTVVAGENQEEPNSENSDSENSVSVTVEFLPQVYLPELSVMKKWLRKESTLRMILSDPTVFVYVNEERIVYKFPEAKSPMSIEFRVEGYEEATAKLEIFVCESQIPTPFSERQRENGVMVRSGTTVYEVSFLDVEGMESPLKYTRFAKYVYGILTCDYLDVLVREHALQKEMTPERLKLNPFMIIEPTRTTGLSKYHPFTKALFAIPRGLYQTTVSRLIETGTAASALTEGFRDFFSKLSENLTSKLIDEETIYTWRTKQEHALLVLANKYKISARVDQDFYMFMNTNSLEDVPTPARNRSRRNINLHLFHDETLSSACEIIHLPDQILIRVNTADPSIHLLQPDIEEKLHGGEISEAAMLGIASVIRIAMVKILMRQNILMGAVQPITTEIYAAVSEAEKELSIESGTTIYGAIKNYIATMRQNN